MKDSFKNFTENVLAIASNYFNDSAIVDVSEYRKNNGLILSGLQIKRKNQKCTPIIYLEQFYDRYLEGQSYDEIFEQILNIYEINNSGVPFDESEFTDFNRASKNIIYRVINYDANKEMLHNIPHRRVLDLALIYYYLVLNDEHGSASAMINNEHMKKWGVDENALYELSKTNTPNLYPSRFQSMQELLNNRIPFDFGVGDKCLDIMYVLTNSFGVGGASCMIYPKVLKDFAKEIDEDLYILPSSVHEVIVLPKSMVANVLEMKELVSFVNDTEVAVSEVLSNNVYFYNRHTGQIEVA